VKCNLLMSCCNPLWPSGQASPSPCNPGWLQVVVVIVNCSTPMDYVDYYLYCIWMIAIATLQDQEFRRIYVC